jgi:hypothetical protein
VFTSHQRPCHTKLATPLTPFQTGLAASLIQPHMAHRAFTIAVVPEASRTGWPRATVDAAKGWASTWRKSGPQEDCGTVSAALREQQPGGARTWDNASGGTREPTSGIPCDCEVSVRA